MDYGLILAEHNEHRAKKDRINNFKKKTRNALIFIYIMGIYILHQVTY